MSRADVEIPIEKATLSLGRRSLVRERDAFDVHFFRDMRTDTTSMAIGCGDLGGEAPLLVRVHSSCVTSECLSGRDCDCVEQLEGALDRIAREGRGLVFYLMQEGRGAGLTAKARDRMIVQASGNRLTTFEAYASMGLPADPRRYDVIGPISRLLGLRAPFVLLTNNPDKVEGVGRALEPEKLEIGRTETLSAPASAWNRDYLKAKFEAGHVLAGPTEGRGLLPPGDVRVFEPTRLPGHAERVVTASYYLPIELPARTPEDTMAGRAGASRIDWFRSSVVFDRRSERESIVLTAVGAERRGGGAMELGPAPGSGPEAEVTMRLVDRLPGTRSPARDALQRALVAIRGRGEGSVVVHFDDRDHAER